jgi:hypothetical protein
VINVIDALAHGLTDELLGRRYSMLGMNLRQASFFQQFMMVD